MKIPLTPLALSVFLLGTASSFAQGLSTNGTITSFSRKDATLTIAPESSSKPLVFPNLQNTRVQRASGRPATLDDLRPGMPTTVYYGRSGNGWFVAKVLIPDYQRVAFPPMPPGGQTSGERQAQTSRAANDGDITTQPGTKARFDRDITTQPGRTLPGNTDITKRPDNR